MKLDPTLVTPDVSGISREVRDEHPQAKEPIKVLPIVPVKTAFNDIAILVRLLDCPLKD